MQNTRIYHDKTWTLDNGNISATAGSVSWTSRFISSSFGRDTNKANSGYIEITFPAVGTLIDIETTVSNHPNQATNTTRAVTATGIQLNAWESLCYQFVPGSTNTTVNSRFFITPTFNLYSHLNEDTIVVVHRGNQQLKWVNGLLTDLNGNLIGVPDTYDFFRTITGSLLPDGTTDTDEDIRRIRDIGLGGVITETIPTIVGAPTQANLHLSNNVANLGQIIRGESPVNYYLQRPVAAIGNTTEVCRMTAGSGAWSHQIGVVVSDGGFASAKNYVMAWNYSDGNFSVKPTADGGAYGANNYELIAKVGAGFVDYFLRRTGGTTSGTYQVTIQSLTGSDEVFQEKSAVAADTTVYTQKDFAPVAQNDFFRTSVTNALPDGTTDPTENIYRSGNTAIGTVQSNTPVAKLDVSEAARTGTDLRSASTGLYVTSTAVGIGVASATHPANNLVANFLHSNQTQGIGISWDGIVRTGSSASLELALKAKGTKGFSFTYPEIEGTFYHDYRHGMSAETAGHQFLEDYNFNGMLNGRQRMQLIDLTRNSQFAWDVQANNTFVTATEFTGSLAELGNTELQVGQNRVHNRKIVLFDGAETSAHQFYGFGVNNSTLRYQVTAGAAHRFFAATSNTTSDEIATITSTGRVGIATPAPLNTLHITTAAVANTTGIRTPLLNATSLATNANGDIIAGGNKTINYQAFTTYTTAATDANNIVVLTNTAPITVTTSNLPVGSITTFIQGSTGTVTFVSGNLNRRHVAALYSAAGQYAIVTITVAGTDAILQGDLS